MGDYGRPAEPAQCRAHQGRPRQRSLRVLCYHAIADLQGAPIIEPYGIPPPEFRRHLQLLTRHFRFISPDEFARYLRGGGVPSRAVLLTFDDCFRDLFVEALPLLREFRVPALAFAVTGKIGGSYDWDEALGAPRLPLVDGGDLLATAEHVTIGSHTRTHRMLNRLPNDALTDEIDGSIADLEALGLPVLSFLPIHTASTAQRSARPRGTLGYSEPSRSKEGESAPRARGMQFPGPRFCGPIPAGDSSGRCSP